MGSNKPEKPDDQELINIAQTMELQAVQIENMVVRRLPGEDDDLYRWRLDRQKSSANTYRYIADLIRKDAMRGKPTS